MKILITGAGGYLAQGLVTPFESRHKLRLMDVKPFHSAHETSIGDVADLDAVRKAVKGVDAILIAHMASRQAGAYETPTVAFDANVKGTANLFFAAVEQHVKKVCVISSSGVLAGYSKDKVSFYTRDLFPKGNDMYTLTKGCQEIIAEQFQRMHNLSVSVLRLGWVMNADTRIDKYNTPHPKYSVGMTDPRDIGEAARLALERNDLTYEVFYVEGTAESIHHCDVEYTRTKLGWTPKYDFRTPSSTESSRTQ